MCLLLIEGFRPPLSSYILQKKSCASSLMCTLDFYENITFKKNVGQKARRVIELSLIIHFQAVYGWHLCMKKQCVLCNKKLVQCWQYEMQISECKKTVDCCTVK
jgi:hypothetical protein